MFSVFLPILSLVACTDSRGSGVGDPPSAAPADTAIESGETGELVGDTGASGEESPDEPILEVASDEELEAIYRSLWGSFTFDAYADGLGRLDHETSGCPGMVVGDDELNYRLTGGCTSDATRVRYAGEAAQVVDAYWSDGQRRVATAMNNTASAWTLDMQEFGVASTTGSSTLLYTYYEDPTGPMYHQQWSFSLSVPDAPTFTATGSLVVGQGYRLDEMESRVDVEGFGAFEVDFAGMDEDGAWRFTVVGVHETVALIIGADGRVRFEDHAGDVRTVAFHAYGGAYRDVSDEFESRRRQP